jgi:hypothetical protein
LQNRDPGGKVKIMINRDFVRGFALGVGVTVLVPVVVAALVVGPKPLGRALSRGRDMLAQKAREAAAEAGEIIEDMIAESRAQTEGIAVDRASAAYQGQSADGGARESGNAARGTD